METGKNGFASGFVLENKGQGEAWVHKRQCRTLTAEGPDHYLPASAGACLWQAAPGNAYPIFLGNAHPIFARHNKDKTTIPFRHS